jgi:hypothetical protein
MQVPRALPVGLHEARANSERQEIIFFPAASTHS